jgi:hypothetical protein
MPELAITTEGWAIARGRSLGDPIEMIRGEDFSLKKGDWVLAKFLTAAGGVGICNLGGFGD